MAKKSELSQINETLKLILLELKKINSKRENAENNVEEIPDDELYKEAKKIVMKVGKASASLLQKKLRVGYARAARFMDMLEDEGIIGPGEGVRPRKVIKN